MAILKWLFWRLSLLYGSVTALRNWAFDHAWLKVTQSALPVVAIGNLSTGGTGKTPHTLWIGEQLSAHFQIAVLSRGYGRKTTGFQGVEVGANAIDIGDEPLLIKQQNPEWTVAVCEKRALGAQWLEKEGKAELIVLDDAMQHRYLHRQLNVLLTRYDNPFYADHLLPVGQLREARKGASRAQFCIVSHCPASLPPEEMTKIRRKIERYTPAEVYFSHMQMKPPHFHGDRPEKEPTEVLLLAGIAQPKSFLKSMQNLWPNTQFKSMFLSDHQHFDANTVEAIVKSALRESQGIIATTEKDFVRLPNSLREHPQLQWITCPIEVVFLENKGKEFAQKLLKHIQPFTKA